MLICRAADNHLDAIVDTLLTTGDRSDPRAGCAERR
jgi:hypothetical protein